MSKSLLPQLKWSVVYVFSYMMSVLMLAVAIFCLSFAFDPISNTSDNVLATIVFCSGCFLSLYLCYRFAKIHLRMWRIEIHQMKKKWHSTFK